MNFRKFKGFLTGFFEERKAVQNAATHLQNLIEKSYEQTVNFVSYLKKEQPDVLKKIAVRNYNLNKMPEPNYWNTFHLMADNGFFNKRWNRYQVAPDQNQDLVGFILKSTLTVVNDQDKTGFFVNLLKMAFAEDGKIHKKIKENKYIYLTAIQNNHDLINLLAENGLAGKKPKMK